MRVKGEGFLHLFVNFLRLSFLFSNAIMRVKAEGFFPLYVNFFRFSKYYFISGSVENSLKNYRNALIILDNSRYLLI